MIKITDFAKEQLELMLHHDHTLKGKGLRLNISGKECEGFVYGIGFDFKREKDLVCPGIKGLDILMDPFAGFYLKNVTIDYQTDFENDQEGFVVTNDDQENFQDKFWKKAPELVPDFTRTPEMTE